MPDSPPQRARVGVAAAAAAGAVAGAALALAAWLADAPEPPREAAGAAARSASTAAPTAASRPQPAAPALAGAPTADATPAGTPPPEEAQRRAQVVAAPDPDLGIIGLGRVSNPDGAFVADAALTFRDAEARTTVGKGGADGRWSAAGLAPAVYDLTVTAEGHLALETAVDVGADVAPDGTWRRDFTLAPARSIPVRFERPDGEPYKLSRFASGPEMRLGVLATAEAPGATVDGWRSHAAHRGVIGTFDLRDGLADAGALDTRYQGLLELHRPPPGWVAVTLGEAVIDVRELSGQEAEFVFVVDPARIERELGSLRVRVVEAATGEVLDGVELRRPWGGWPITGTLEGGVYHFEALTPDPYRLERGGFGPGDGLEQLSHRIDVPPRAQLDLGTIALGASHPLRIRLVDADGEPLRLRVHARPVDAAPTDAGARLYTDHGGRATIANLAPGPLLLRAGGDDGLAATLATVDTRGLDGELEIVVPRGTDVAILLPGEGGWSGAILDAEGREVAPVEAGRSEVCLAPGAYTLVAGPPGGAERRLPLVVGSEPQRVEVTP